MPCPLPQSWRCRSCSSARQQLVEQRTVLLQQQAQHLNSIVRRLDRARLKLLQRQIAQLELAIGSILEEQSALKQKVERLQQVKGVGLITAVTCVALCPELGSLSRGQIAALVGVAPYDDDSGARKGWRHIAGGRPRLRRALYMAAISALRSNPILRRFYQQLRQRNKSSKVALVAVIRKLAILLNQLLRNSFLFASKLNTVATAGPQLFFLLTPSKLLVPLFSSHAVLPISSRGSPVVRTNIRVTDRTANARLACHSIRPACANFRADWLGQNVGGVSRFSRWVVSTRRGRSFA